ncbi:hypothetical protein [Mycobacterium attenuatum]|uniref:hypothetical protein n=1 Tax=Mycobacterium attenuatum TaxID=2341086 RepID=UPI001459FF43|nr:hypothetical protein [Mycobacterium attenuatum]
MKRGQHRDAIAIALLGLFAGAGATASTSVRTTGAIRGSRDMTLLEASEVIGPS